MNCVIRNGVYYRVSPYLQPQYFGQPVKQLVQRHTNTHRHTQTYTKTEAYLSVGARVCVYVWVHVEKFSLCCRLGNSIERVRASVKEKKNESRKNNIIILLYTCNKPLLKYLKALSCETVCIPYIHSLILYLEFLPNVFLCSVVTLKNTKPLERTLYCTV